MNNIEEKNIIENEEININENTKKYIPTRLKCDVCGSLKNIKVSKLELIDNKNHCKKCVKKINFVDKRKTRYNNKKTSSYKPLPKILISEDFINNNSGHLIMRSKSNNNTIIKICKDINDMNDFIKMYKDRFNPFA